MHLRSGIASLHCFRCIWKAAKNCWSRKVSTLLPKCEENLCVMSTVDLTFIALITQRFCSHFGTNVESLRLHFVLHPTTSGIRHCYFLLVCLFWLQRRWWHFVARYSPRNKFVSQWKNEPVIHIDDISSHPSPSSPLWCVFSDYQTMSTRQPMFVPVLQFVLCWRWWIWTTSPWSSARGWRRPGDHSSSKSKYDRR